MNYNDEEKDLDLDLDLLLDDEEGVSILDVFYLIFIGMPVNFLVSGAIAMWGWNHIVGNVFVTQDITFAQGVLVVLALQLIRTLSEDLFLKERIIRSLVIAVYTAVFVMVHSLVMGVI